MKERAKKLSYGQNPDKKLVFPFLTYQDSSFAEFMTIIMKNLEIR